MEGMRASPSWLLRSSKVVRDGLAELDDGVPLNEADHYAGVVHRLAGLILEDDIDFGHGCGQRTGGKAGEQGSRHHKGGEETIPIAHIPIINARWRRGGRMGL